MNILFRADSSSFIGTGHIMRDLVLTKQFKYDNIVFAVRDLPGNINHKIDELGYRKIILKTSEFNELNSLIKKLSIDMIIIDHYEIDYNFEKNLKKINPDLKIFVFDDTYEKHYCDILLNHNISANRKKYKNLVPTHCELKCGIKYTLLREEFFQIQKEKYKIKKTKKNNEYCFFIAMGGADHSHINIKILKVLNLIKKKKNINISIDIVTTNANKNIKKLINFCKNKSWITLHINSNEIARLMKQNDFSIVTPSVTVNEVYYLNLPMIGIKTAENQIDMYKYLKNNYYPTIAKFNKNQLEIALNTILRRKFYGKN